jgi:hypothetical protein
MSASSPSIMPVKGQGGMVSCKLCGGRVIMSAPSMPVTARCERESVQGNV